MNEDAAILAALLDAQDTPRPEAELARRAGVTVKELRQRVEGLRHLGYAIEAHPGGLRLAGAPDALIPEEIRARLREGRRIGSRILVFETTSSTNDVAERLASQGHAAGLVVFAEAQTAGRGRQGRSWISPPRKGLWFTVLLRSALRTETASRLTVMAGVAAVTSLRRMTGLPLRIKWPNDILCRGRKIAGILAELSVGPDRALPPGRALLCHALIGIGIDVNLERSDFPESLRDMATSLKLEAGRSFHRPTLAADLLDEIERCEELMSDESFPRLVERWVESDDTLGRQISIATMGGHRLHGLAMNLDHDGALLLRTDDGRVQRVVAGDVTLEKEFS